MFKLHLWDRLGWAGGWGDSGLGIIRLGSAEKTALGRGIKHRPGLRKTQTRVRMNGVFQIDTIR